MPITAIPPGVEFRKITQVQKRALDEYLGKEKETTLLQTVLSSLIPSITAVGIATGIGVVAWAYLKDLSPKEIFTETIEGAGGGMANAILEGIDKVGEAFNAEQNPKTPEQFTLASGKVVTLSRCQRWEYDANDALATIQAGDLNKAETTALALTMLNIAKQMKKEGCTRPTSISQAQWNQAK